MKFDFAGPGAARRPTGASRHGARAIATILAIFAAQIASLPLPVQAAEPAKGVSSRSVREDALRSIPLKQLQPEAHAKVSAVLNDISIFRRLPTQTVDCDPALFHFLVSNPDVVVDIWRIMGVSNVSMDRLDADHFRGSDGDGTTCRAEFVFHNHDTHIIYSEGVYDGPLFARPIRGQCVAVLKSAEIRETNGRYYVTARLDVFLHVDNTGVELLAKMFQGWLGKTIDHNFTETIAFLGNISNTAETNPQGMRKLAGRLERVDAQRRGQFAVLVDQVPRNLATVDLAGGQRPPTARP
jgi:hypothetical protein